jgi:hypothetical protein
VLADIGAVTVFDWREAIRPAGITNAVARYCPMSVRVASSSRGFLFETGERRLHDHRFFQNWNSTLDLARRSLFAPAI